MEEDQKVLEEFIELDRKIRQNKVESDYDEFCERRCIAIENLLKAYKELKAELEKKDKEIDILKTNNEIMQGELDRIGIDTLKLEKGMSTDDVIEEIKKKEKIINLMAEQLTTDIHSKEWVIDYYEKEVEKGKEE